MTAKRARVDEWMDDPGLDPDRHLAALRGLSRLNRISMVSGVFFSQLARLAAMTPGRPLRVLDVASGSADLPIDWLRRAKKREMQLQVTALDRSDVAMRAAADSAKVAKVELGTVVRDCLKDGLPSGFDVVTNSLFMHHLEDFEAVRLIQEMWRVSDRAVVICDLERSIVNVGLVGLGSRIVTRSDVVHHDAIASVRGAYSRDEFSALLRQAMGFPVPVRMSFPCRFLAVLDQLCEVELAKGRRPVMSGMVS